MWALAAGSAVVLLLAVLLLWQRRALRRWKQAALQCRASFATLAEQARTQIARTDAILTGMPDGIMMLDANLKLVEWNARFPEFAGVPKELLRVGLDISEILRAQAEAGEFGPVDIEAEVSRRMALLQTGGSTGVIERTRPGGRTLELRRSPLSGGGFITLYTDVSKRRDAENQLRQAQKMEAVGHLTGGAAHDFNNLLMVILGNLDLAQQALDASELLRAQRKIETAQAGAQRAAALTKRLLAFARRQSLEPQPVDANRIVSGMASIIRHSIGSNTELETVLAGGLWDALIDPNQLENALLNLAINARDAMPDGGKVTIETANAHLDAAYAERNGDVAPGQYVLVAVSDGGTGMTPEAAAHAFEPFFTTKGVGKGSGLGLSQVFGFVKQSKGHVKIYTELGAGTTVKLYLPRLAAKAASVIETGTPQPELPRACPGECILVVEDDADVLAYAAEVLEGLDYQVVGATDAPSALSALSGRPDVSLLLADIELPGLNGPELAAEAMQRRPGLCVLYMTGYTSNAVVHRGILAGQIRSINKPFTLQELATAVRRALDSRGGGAEVHRLHGG